MIIKDNNRLKQNAFSIYNIQSNKIKNKNVNVSLFLNIGLKIAFLHAHMHMVFQLGLKYFLWLHDISLQGENHIPVVLCRIEI